MDWGLLLLFIMIDKIILPKIAARVLPLLHSKPAFRGWLFRYRRMAPYHPRNHLIIKRLKKHQFRTSSFYSRVGTRHFITICK